MSTVTKDIYDEVRKAICGKDHVIAQTLTGILAGGHILMEDVPGVGKTTLALAFSKTMGLDYGRVQFTPDVLPSDITGFSLYDKTSGTMKYQPGAVFHNLFLADELNRASSRTQSALLEAMEESRVTVDGNTYLLPKPFTVIATQNPAGSSGTSLLPDSQVDRFMIRISMGYPSSSAEKAMIEARKNGINPLDDVKTVCDINTLVKMQQEVNNVFVHEKVIDLHAVKGFDEVQGGFHAHHHADGGQCVGPGSVFGDHRGAQQVMLHGIARHGIDAMGIALAVTLHIFAVAARGDDAFVL